MIRVQRKRTKGWQMPVNTISVARPGRWGNPFPVKADTPAWKSLRLFVLHLAEMEPARLDELVNGLVGHNVACWCPPKACCHADVWLWLAACPDNLALFRATFAELNGVAQQQKDTWAAMINLIAGLGIAAAPKQVNRE